MGVAFLYQMISAQQPYLEQVRSKSGSRPITSRSPELAWRLSCLAQHCQACQVLGNAEAGEDPADCKETHRYYLAMSRVGLDRSMLAEGHQFIDRDLYTHCRESRMWDDHKTTHQVITMFCAWYSGAQVPSAISVNGQRATTRP